MIAKEDVVSIFEALYDQLVVSHENDKLTVDDYEVIVENFKCVYKDFSDKRKLDNISREEFQDGRLNSHLRAELQVEGRQHICAGAAKCESVAGRIRKILPVDRAEAIIRRAIHNFQQEGGRRVDEHDDEQQR